MAQTSAIEWCEATLNPWTGCTKVDPACAHCYIENTPPFRMSGRRFERGHIPLVFHMERLTAMMRRRKPTLYFVNSLSDLFHEDAGDEQIALVFAAMASAPQHTFQILTKRHERMRDLMRSDRFILDVANRATADTLLPIEWPLPNVWLGVTIGNRRFVHRADVLRETPAAVRFISAEPLLGPLICREALHDGEGTPCACASDERDAADRHCGSRVARGAEGGHGSRAGGELPAGAVHTRGAEVRRGGTPAGVDGDMRASDTSRDGHQPSGRGQDEQLAIEPGSRNAGNERGARASHTRPDQATPDCWCGPDARSSGDDDGSTAPGRAKGRDCATLRRYAEDREVSRSAGGVHGGCLDLTGIDWLIVVGESGPKHRPMRLEWARDLVAACREAGVAPFVKQLGGARPGTALEDLPEDLRIRECPAVAR